MEVIICCVVQREAEQLLEQNHQLLEYISELVNCLSQTKSLSLNHIASPTTTTTTTPGQVGHFIAIHQTRWYKW